MKAYVLSFALVVAFVAAGLLVVAADDLPQTQNFARYEAMMNRSPFAVATAEALPAATPNFAKDLFVANAAKLESEDVVTLNSSTDKNFREYLSTRSPNEHGYSIANIEWSDKIGQTKVTISKDGQTATLSFNQALISQTVANSAPQPPYQPPPQAQPQGVGVPPVPQYNNNVNVMKPAPVPQLPGPPPRTRGVIQRNPSDLAVPAQPDTKDE